MNASLHCIVLLSCVVTGFCSTGLNSGSSQPIMAAPGLDVVLPCRLDPPIDLQRFAVEWLKLGPKTSASGDTVYLYRDGKEEAREKIWPYVGRTQMFTDQLEHGNMSLKILNVTSADAGRYRCKCFIQGKVEDADVQLVVNPDLKTTTETSQHPTNIQMDHEEVDQTSWIVTLVCCFLFVPTVIVIGFLIKRQRQKRPQNLMECDVVPIKESADLEPPL